MSESFGTQVHLAHSIDEQQRTLDRRMAEFLRNEFVRAKRADLQQQASVFSLLQALAPHSLRNRRRGRLRTNDVAGDRNKAIAPEAQAIGIIPIDRGKGLIGPLEV